MVQLVQMVLFFPLTSTYPGFWFALATDACDEAEPPVARD
uniref:Uncharacterized protein n=2 Tax=Picea TaxID=3328 RepID=A0A101M5D9_PICGL|nr:hypothetical protein ABT39_MTgene1043 [Picea glauca]QHR90028.1 hypothetical protein Q903MT_gene4051 [Picea sitchensis]